MMRTTARSARPKLIRNCRLSGSPSQADTLLMPEGILRLKGSGRAIIELCDGSRSVDEIVGALRTLYQDRNPGQLEEETLEFLNLLRQKRVVEY